MRNKTGKIRTSPPFPLGHGARRLTERLEAKRRVKRSCIQVNKRVQLRSAGGGTLAANDVRRRVRVSGSGPSGFGVRNYWHRRVVIAVGHNVVIPREF